MSRIAMRVGRRRLLRGGVALAIATTALVGAAGLTAAPAMAATAAPRVHLVSGDRTITASWNRVPTASRYIVRYSTNRWMHHAHSKTVRSLSVQLTRLANHHTYWVTVKPVSTMFSARATRISSTVHTAPSNGMPTPVSHVKARPGGANQVIVSWSGGSRFRKVAVIAGADSMTDVGHFTSRWYPAGTTSITLTVPSKYRTLVGAGTGNAIFVKVVQSNSGSNAMHLVYTPRDAYRLSSPGTYTLAGSGSFATSAAITRLRVGTLNVGSEPSTKNDSPEHRWASRLPRIVNTIEAAKPDLFGAEELDTTRMDSSCIVHVVNGVPQYCTEQYDTMASALAGASTPYRIAATSANAFIRNEELAHSGSAVVDSHLFYNPAVLSVVSAGYFSPKYDLHVPWNQSQIGDDRGGSWAVFQINATGQRFLASAVHFTVGSSAAQKLNRRQEAAALASYLDAKAATPSGTMPIVLVGDFNSFAPYETNGPSTALVGKGYFDSASTMNRSNWRWSTTNSSNGVGGVDSGYPVHARIHPYPTNRIDYVMLKGSPFTYRYDNVMHISRGVFQSQYQGSDHNLQIAQVGIASSVLAP